jgi:hypothetical protein
MKTRVSTITVEFNGYTGFFDVEIVHLPETATEHESWTATAFCIQEVEEKIHEFRINHEL